MLRRPEANPDFWGHEAAERFLWQAWHGSRLAHAWLIRGARGIGKATLACRFARFLLATGLPRPEDGMSASPLSVPPEHPTFRQIAAGCHSDFRLIERSHDDSGQWKKSLLIEDIRNVIEFISLTPAIGKWKVVVIDDAETMNNSAGNAILKVLEEPAPQSLFLLVSHNSGLLLPTIRSRCSILTLCPLTEFQVRILLELYRPTLTPQAVSALASLAEGSIGQALALADHDGVTLYMAMLDLLAKMPSLHGPALHDLSNRVAQADTRLFTIFGELLRAWLIRVVRCGVTGRQVVEVIPGEAGLASRLTTTMRLDQWVEVWEKIGYLFSRAEVLNLDRRQVVISALCAVGKLAQP